MTLSSPISTDEIYPLRVELTEGGQVTGRVVDPNGVPLRNATVMPLSLARGNSAGTFDRFVSDLGSVLTTETGFRLGHLPAGRETLKVTHPDYAFELATDIEVVEGQTTKDVEIILSRGGGLSGELLDGAGALASGVALSVQDQERGRLAFTVTDAAGRFSVTGLPPGELCFVERRNQEASGLAEWVFLSVEGLTARADWADYATVYGAIQINGEPVANRQLILTYPGHWSSAFRYGVITDEAGEFTLRGIPPGKYELRLRQAGERERWIPIHTFVCGDADIDLGTVALEWSSVEVTLTGVQQKLGPWELSLWGEAGLSSWPVGDIVPPQEAGGPYLITNVPVGTRQLVARGAVTVRRMIEVVPSAEPLKVSLEIPEGTASVGGSFESSVRQPFALWNADQTITAHINGSLDSYQIDHLPAGRYRVGHTIPRDSTPLIEFVLRDGEQKTLDLNTDTWPTDPGFFTLNVVSEEGQVLSHAAVWLEGKSGRLDPAKEWGWYFAFYPPVGEYRLMIQCDGYQTYSEAITIWPYRWYSQGVTPQTKIIRMAQR